MVTVVQYWAEADRPFAVIIQGRVGGRLAKARTLGFLANTFPDMDKLIVVGAQAANPIFKKFTELGIIDEVTEDDAGFIYIQVGDWAMIPLYTAAGWHAEDTRHAADYIFEHGLPSETVRIEFEEVPPPPEEEFVLPTGEELSIWEKFKAWYDKWTTELREMLPEPLQKLVEFLERGIDYFVGIPGGLDLFLGGISEIPAGVRAIKGIGTAAAESLEVNLLRKSAEELFALAKKFPKSVAGWIDDTSLGDFTKLTNQLSKTKEGRIALVEMSKATGRDIVTETGFTEVVAKSPSFFKKFMDVLKWVTFAGLGTLGLGSIVGHLKKEVPEPIGMAVWALIESAERLKTKEAWESARDGNEKYKDMIEGLKPIVDPAKKLNPFTTKAYDEVEKAQLDQYEAYKTIIEDALAALEPEIPPEETCAVTIEAKDRDTEEPLKANIFLGGKLYTFTIEGKVVPAKTPYTIEMKRGDKVLIEAKLVNYESLETLFEVPDEPKWTQLFLLPKIEAIPTKGMLGITTVPVGANVWLDETLHAYKTNTVIKDLIPKDYLVRVQLDGYEEDQQKVTVVAGEQEDIFFALVPSVAPPTKGIITVKTTPVTGALIWVNDISQDIYSPRSIELDPAEYKIKVTKSGYKDAEEIVTIGAGESKVITLTLEKIEVPVEVPDAWHTTISAVDAVTGESITAKIIINDVFQEKYTTDSVWLKPNSTYILRLEKAGYEDFTMEIKTEAIP